MSLKDYLKKNGLGGLANSVGAPLTFKLSADETVLHQAAEIKDTDVPGKFKIEFWDAEIADHDGDGNHEFILKPDGAVDVTKEFAFISFNTVYDTDTSKYTYTNKAIHFIPTESYSTSVEVTDVLLIADAQAQGIDVSEATGPTISVTRNRSDWKVVSCVKEVVKGREIVYDGSKAVTINLF